MKLVMFFLLVFVCIFSCDRTHAQSLQWKNAAPFILQAPGGMPEYGAIKSKGSTILAGWMNLVLSTDYGKSWQKVQTPFSGTTIWDLDMYDDHTFVVMTSGSTYYSSDQGASWSSLQAGGGRGIVFDNSPTSILLVKESSGTSVYSIQVGGSTTQSALPFSGVPIDVQIGADRTWRVIAHEASSEGLIFTSSDRGLSWMPSNKFIGGDDNIFIADNTDPARIVAVNEDWAFKTDDNADLFLSTDYGLSWQHPYSHSRGNFADLNGNAAQGCNDYFVGTQAQGILRSNDKGVTWTTIGGPSTAIDSRSLCASDDSFIVAIDQQGSIWITDPISHGRDNPFVSGDKFFRDLTMNLCDSSVASTIIFSNTACSTLNISDIEITGSDSLDYQIVDSLKTHSLLPDSIRVRFTPGKPGKQDSRLKVTYVNGSTKYFDIGATVSSPTLSLKPMKLFGRDTLDLCTSMNDTLSVSALCPVNISSISIVGNDADQFVLVGKTTASLPADSLIIITCNPLQVGNLNASLHLIAFDGRIWDIPLAPFIGLTPTVKIDQNSLSSAFTDTIGGDIIVRIKMKHTGRSTNAEFTVHYDDIPLQYQGVFDTLHKDHTIGHPDSRSVRIGFNTTTDSVLYARFSFFPVDSNCTSITIDSITSADGGSKCLNVLTTSVNAEICSPAACGRTTLARYERFGIVPQFAISPNPSSGRIRLFSDRICPAATIDIVDGLGQIRQTLSNINITQQGTLLDTDELTNGIYQMILKNNSYRRTMTFVIIK